MRNALFTGRAIWLAAALCATLVAPASAGLLQVDIGKNLQQTQLDAAGTLSSSSAFFAARAFYQNPGDYDAATLTYPGPGSPATMTNVPGTIFFLGGGSAAGDFIAQSPLFPDQATMDAAYPFGDYRYDLTDSTLTNPPATTTLSYTSDLYPANLPTVTAPTFTGLQGLDPTQDFTISFAALQNDPDFSAGAGDQAFIFLDVFTAGFGSDVFSQFSTSASSFLMPANTLAPNTSYALDLIFDNRHSATVDGIGQSQLFDLRTEVDFTTAAAAAPAAAPEPSSLLLIGLGAAAASFPLRRRRRALA